MSNWSSFKKDQLIMESWRNFLDEDVGTLTKTTSDLYSKPGLSKRIPSIKSGEEAEPEEPTPEEPDPSSEPITTECTPKDFVLDLLGYAVGAGLKPLMLPVKSKIDTAIAAAGVASRNPVLIALSAANSAFALAPVLDSAGDQVIDLTSYLLTQAIGALILPEESDYYDILVTFVGPENVDEFCSSWTDAGEIIELYRILNPPGMRTAQGLNRLVKADYIFKDADDLRDVKIKIAGTGFIDGVFWLGAFVADTLMPGKAHPITKYLGLNIFRPPDPVYTEEL